MKREILFRGKSIGTGEWLYGYLFNYGLTAPTNVPCICVCVPKSWKEADNLYTVNPESIGQYTGLKDKNGVKIFEGDIIKTPRGSIGEVVFGRAEEECTHMEHRRKITDVYTTYGWVFKRADGFTIAIDDEILQGELIGNVTDSPEMVKGGLNEA